MFDGPPRTTRRLVRLSVEVLEDRSTPAALTAAPDTFETGTNVPTLLDVLSNDSFGGTDLQLQSVTPVSPSGPTLAQNADGTFAFTSAAPGTFSFDYTIADGQHLLSAPDALGSSLFGAVAISGDTAVLGSALLNVAEVFVRGDRGWVRQAELTAAALGDDFGAAVSIEGNTIVIGAPFRDIGGNSDQGAAYVFTRSGSTWAQQAGLIAADGTADNRFGSSVSVSENGNTIVIGAPFRDIGGNSDQGAAYVFTRSAVNAGWTQRAELVARDGGAFDRLGASVGVSGDTVLIGAPEHDVGSNTSQGAAYVFGPGATGGPTSAWVLRAELTTADGVPGDFFGDAVSIEGSTVVIGAPSLNIGIPRGPGAAYVFTRSGSTWMQQAELTAADGSAEDSFGSSVSVAEEGDAVVIGAPDHDVGGNKDQGAAYVFVPSGGTWVLQRELTASDGGRNDSFGSGVGVSGGTVVVGAPALLPKGDRAYIQNLTRATATATVTVLASSLSGRVFRDYNADGGFDGPDLALSGVELFVDSNGNGALDVGEPVAVSNDLGNYFFAGLDPGSLTLRVVLPPRAGTTGPGAVGAIDLALGQSLTGLDVGVTGPANVSLPLSAATEIFVGSYPGPAPALAGALYRAVLGRAGDPAGAAALEAALEQGTPAPQAALLLFGSHEYHLREVRSDYRSVLGRAADASGSVSWTAKLDAGASNTDVLLGLLGSPEYELQHPKSTDFVDALYRTFLGREPDPTGEAFYVGRLNSGTTRADVARAILDSQEYRANALEELYAQLLQRPITPAELPPLLSQLAQGAPLDEIAAGILGSPEFAQYAARTIRS